MNPIYPISLFVGGITNMTPSFLAKIFPNLKYPLDFGLKIKGKRILGDHKTIRGIVGGSITGSLVATVISLFLYPLQLSFILLIPFSALIGDAVKSFLKRQKGIKEGEPFFPFDQLDWILGVCCCLYFIGYRDITILILLIISGFILHLLIKFLGYLIKLDEKII